MATGAVHFFDASRFLSASGATEGGVVYFYYSGTTNLAPIYSDIGLTTAKANPVVIGVGQILPNIYLDPQINYRRKIIFYSDGSVFDEDPIAMGADAAQIRLQDKANAILGQAQAYISNGGVPYANAYASTLPNGVTTITITNGGSGYTNGTYTGGIAGGPTGFAWTYTVSGNIVTSVTITNPGLSTSTTAPILTFPSGGGTGAAATASVNSLIPNQKAYAVASSDSTSVLIVYNNAGTVAPLNNPDGTQIAFLNAREFRRFIARLSLWQNTPYAVANPHILRVNVNLAMVDASTPPDCYVYDIRRDLTNRFNLVVKRVSDNATIGSVYLSSAPIDPTTYPGANGGIGQCVLPLLLTATGISAGFSDISNIEVDWGAGETWGAPNDGTNTTTLLLSNRMVFSNSQKAQVSAVVTSQLLNSSSVFKPASTDTYAKKIFTGGIIEGGDRDDTFYLNYETVYFSAIPLYRIRFFLYSTKLNSVVGQWDYQSASNPIATLTASAASVKLSQMSNGSHPFGSDAAIDAIFDIDWSKVTFDKVLTTYTNGAATGINQSLIWTTEDTEHMWLSEKVPPYRTVTVGALTGQYATVVAALAAINDSIIGGGTYNRSTYPSSNKCSPGRPWLVEIVDPHTEVVTEYQFLGIWQSPLRLPHGCILRTRADTVIYMTAAGSPNGAPVVEMNWTSRLEGPGLIRQESSGYVVHIDNSNGISAPSDVGAPINRRKIQTIIKDVTLRKVPDSTVPIIGSSISNGQTILIDGAYLYMDANTSNTDFVFVHASPNTTHPGLVHLKNVNSNIANQAGVATLAVNKNYSYTVRHGVLVTNSDCYRIEVSATAGGAPGWIRKGPLNGITVTGNMEP